jgi:hypothetical protein
MKIASGIISLVFGAIILLQSVLVGVGGTVIGEEAASQGGSVGIVVALLFIIGGAFAFGLPKVAMIFSIIACIFGIAVGSTTTFKDMTIWGVLALIIAVMEYFAGRKKKSELPPTS